jgi:hypothetical protein
VAVTAPTLSDEFDTLPADPSRRALAVLKSAGPSLGVLQAVDMREDAEGWHITLHSSYGVFSFLAPAVSSYPWHKPQ